MSEGYEAMVASWAERELDLKDNEGQEKLSVQRNRIEQGPSGAPEIGLRLKITQHTSVLGTKVYGLVHKICWGSHNGNQACLLVVRFRLTSSSGVFRLRKAVITIRFDNHPPRVGPRPPAGGRSDSVLRMFSPRQIYGIPTNVHHGLGWSVAAQSSVSTGAGTVGPQGSRMSSTRYATEVALEIAGMDDVDRDKDLPNIVVFEIDENPKTSRGVPRELYFGAVVQCDGPIQADIETSIGDRSAWPWTRDDPIILRPGSDHGDVPPSIPRNFDQLTDDDWKILVPYQEETLNAVQWSSP